MAGNGQKLTRLRQRVFKMVSVGVVDDRINQGYDAISTGLLLLNLIGAFAGTFDSYAAKYGVLLHHIESVTVAFFALDYVLRMYTAPCLYPDEHGARPYMRYALSGAGIIDLMSFLPYYLPMFFPAGAVAFRLIRVARILRLFRINAYYDSMNVITDVIAGKSRSGILYLKNLSEVIYIESLGSVCTVKLSFIYLFNTGLSYIIFTVVGITGIHFI